MNVKRKQSKTVIVCMNHKAQGVVIVNHQRDKRSLRAKSGSSNRNTCATHTHTQSENDKIAINGYLDDLSRPSRAFNCDLRHYVPVATERYFSKYVVTLTIAYVRAMQGKQMSLNCCRKFH